MEFRAEQFSIEFEHEKKWYPAVTDLNMHIDAGEMVALIGESGCGKTKKFSAGLWITTAVQRKRG